MVNFQWIHQRSKTTNVYLDDIYKDMSKNTLVWKSKENSFMGPCSTDLVHPLCTNCNSLSRVKGYPLLCKT